VLPYLHSIGLSLKAVQIREEILKDPLQTVVLTTDGPRVLAAIRYKKEVDHLFVKAINLSELYSLRAFRGIMQEGWKALSEESEVFVESVVQVSNVRSLELHRKLGFERIKEMPKAIRFRVKREDLLERLRMISAPAKLGVNLDE
jgi:hypothetical protein